MAIHDVSTVRAIIKSGITRFRIQSVDRAARLDLGSIKSNARLYQELKKVLRDEFSGYVIYDQEGEGSGLSRKQAWVMVCFDLDASLEHSSTDYPLVFYATSTTVSLRKVRQVPSIRTVMAFSRHMLERVVRREQCGRLEDAMACLAPLAHLAITMNTRRIPYFQWGTFTAISVNGYAICSTDDASMTPLVITWVPRRWWTKRQYLKLRALESHLMQGQGIVWALMNADEFNNAEVVSPASIPDEKFIQTLEWR